MKKAWNRMSDIEKSAVKVAAGIGVASIVAMGLGVGYAYMKKRGGK